MSSVFYHLTRTGGSTLWHTLAASAPRNQVSILDLFYLSSLKFGSAYNALSTLRDYMDDESFKRNNMIIHHHSRQNIADLLDPAYYAYITVIRDPLDRLISEVAHVRKSLLDKTFAMGETQYYNENLSEGLWRMMTTTKSVNFDDLLMNAANDRFFRDYYIQSFWQLLCSEPDDGPVQFCDFLSEQSIIDLARKTRESFMFIGTFQNIRTNIEAALHITNMRFEPNSCVKNVNCGAVKPILKEGTASAIKENMANEYKFINEIIHDDPPQPASCYSIAPGTNHSNIRDGGHRRARHLTDLRLDRQ